MTELQSALRSAYESAGYDVDSVDDNRGQIRVSLQARSPDVGEIRQITSDVCGEDAVLGFDVTSEAIEDDDAVGTVVSFRHRP